MNKIVAFDVETPNGNNDRVCSIGLTVIKNGDIKETISYLVNPEVEFDDKNISIHGITPDQVINAPIFPEVWREINELMRESLLVAHNATFDLCVLKKTLQNYYIYESSISYICTLQISRRLFNDVENHKLSTLSKKLGIELIHHEAGSDSRCCAEILCNCIKKGILIDEYIKTFDLSSNDNCNNYIPKKQLSTQTQALNELKGILFGITCDDVLNVAEVISLQDWLCSNKRYEGSFPYDDVSAIVYDALQDGILTQCEIDSMKTIFKQICDPVNNTCVSCNNREISGKKICITGEFDFGNRTEVEQWLEKNNAICQKSVCKDTDYVIVGNQGSIAWCAGNYGTKLKRAVELQNKGYAIKIVKEDELLKM